MGTVESIVILLAGQERWKLKVPNWRRRHSHEDGRRSTEIGAAAHVLNQMRELERPISVRIA
jgi:hypothetical protein